MRRQVPRSTKAVVDYDATDKEAYGMMDRMNPDQLLALAQPDDADPKNKRKAKAWNRYK